MEQPFVGSGGGKPRAPQASQHNVNINDYLSEKPVTPVMVRLRCVSCLKGELKFTGMTNQSNPPQYQHRCECGAEMAIGGKHFPCVEFKDPTVTPAVDG